MRIACITCFAILATSAAVAQQQQPSQRTVAGATTFSASSNLPIERIGDDDLLGISVYDAPELTGTVRVNSNGDIRLPMLKEHIHAAGLLPEGLESAIAKALTDGKVLVDPIVTVNVVEYRSRPITVIGAVRAPTTFQADGPVTLLDAISRSGGIAESAGSEILVTHSSTDAGTESVTLTEHIPVQSLMNPNSPAANLELLAGDIVRVPVAGQVYVLGDVNKPGAINITDGTETSVLKALVLSGGVARYSGHTAHIYRVKGDRLGRVDIPIKLKQIMEFRSPDVPLMADDILYIPDATGRRISAQALVVSLGLSVSLADVLIYATR